MLKLIKENPWWCVSVSSQKSRESLGMSKLRMPKVPFRQNLSENFLTSLTSILTTVLTSVVKELSKCMSKNWTGVKEMLWQEEMSKLCQNWNILQVDSSNHLPFQIHVFIFTHYQVIYKSCLGSVGLFQWKTCKETNIENFLHITNTNFLTSKTLTIIKQPCRMQFWHYRKYT